MLVCGRRKLKTSTVTGIARPYRSHSLDSLKGGYMGDCLGDYFRGYDEKGDRRSLDYSL